jgi:hypothetical protein
VLVALVADDLRQVPPPDHFIAAPSAAPERDAREVILVLVQARADAEQYRDEPSDTPVPAVDITEVHEWRE